MARAVIETWRVDKLTVIDKLKINDLILLLSGTNGPLLRYMHVCKCDRAMAQRQYLKGHARKGPVPLEPAITRDQFSRATRAGRGQS